MLAKEISQILFQATEVHYQAISTEIRWHIQALDDLIHDDVVAKGNPHYKLKQTKDHLIAAERAFSEGWASTDPHHRTACWWQAIDLLVEAAKKIQEERRAIEQYIAALNAVEGELKRQF